MTRRHPLDDEQLSRVRGAISGLQNATEWLESLLRPENSAPEATARLEAANRSIDAAVRELDGLDQQLLVLHSERSWARRARGEIA